MTRTITVEAGGETYAGQIGAIRSTTLGYEDHGIFTAYLAFEGPGWGVSVGGYALDTRKDDGTYNREGTAFGLDQLIWIMRTVGVRAWEDLKGKQAIVLYEGEGSVLGRAAAGIASTTDEREVLIFREHADQWKESHE